jgi:hypothetical protein
MFRGKIKRVTFQPLLIACIACYLINRNISEEDPGMPCRVLPRREPFRELYRG